VSGRASKLLVLDTDDVLVHIATPWMMRAFSNPAVAPGWTRPTGLDERAVVARTYPHIQPWLVAVHGLPKDAVSAFDDVYRRDPMFYDDLPPTRFCQGVMAAMAKPGCVEHVHVITHNYSNGDPSAESKDRWLRRYLSDAARVTIHNVESGEKKSEVMRKHCPNPDTFADDSLKNVVDVLLNDAVSPYEILIPRMGHNEVLPPEMAKLALLRRISINYYENII
jgi:hypothetical protein